TPRLSAEALNLVTPSSSPSATQPEPTKANGPQHTSVQNDSTTSPLANVRGSVCLNELSQSLGTPLLMFPIALEQSLGFAVFFCDASACHKVGPSAFCERASKLWLEASVFENLIQQLDSWLVVHRCNLFMKLVGFSEWIRTRPRWWLVPIGVSSMALFAPVPYFPKRECVFEPESKQYLSSPIQGRIASCDVRPGDRVEMDQLLAKLDDDELRRELATARAEFEGAEKKRDTALATRAMGNMGLADVEKQQALWRIESIEEQLRRLEIRASAAGVVVQGDWHRSVGMPVTLGQSLFEVATLESMTAEVRLNASDLGHINVGDEVSIRSDASGGTSFRGEISRIEPRATIIDDKAVFIADVVIHDPDLLLRPGMKATAQVKAGWKSLGWILFDRPYRWLANQWIW
ncbi:MAG: efflux RND transporter periplasmic adaptor subunit, partial [Pirellula sp.]